jgi:hypothetical protein
VTSAARAALAASRAELRQSMAARGFADDGDVLRGPVRWQTPDGPAATAVIDISVPDRYPFGPPVVRVVDEGGSLEVAFHRDLDGGLCLWDTDEPVSGAPWTDPDLLLSRIAGWLERTAAGWPGDDDCDLDRYLPASGQPGLVLYDYDAIRPIRGYLRTSLTENPRAVTLLAATWNPPARPVRNKPRTGKKAALPSAPRCLAFAADLGRLRWPIQAWEDIAAALGECADEVRRYINQGDVELLLLWYRRSGREAALALAVEPGRPPVITTREAADTGLAARTLRAGTRAADLASRRVTIVGCGAVGSYIADLLYREGARRLSLIDGQLLRPGNVIRHIAPPDLVGYPKVDAVKHVLHGYDLGGDILTSQSKITSPEQALDILNSSDLVIDATADERATAMLCWAAAAARRPVITVCVQREGGIARADRFPLRGDEQHLPAVPVRAGSAPVRERGCGDAISLTPPSAVAAAAELAVELARDELTFRCALPASVLRVLQPQPDSSYDRLSTLTAERRAEREAAS